MTALTALLGAGAGLGLLLIFSGWRKADSDHHHRMPALSQMNRDRLAIKFASAVGAIVLVGAITGWPVAALLAGIGAVTLPTVMGGSKHRAREVARTEAIAGWAEMLRDTLSAAAGLEQAIVATADVAPSPIRTEVRALASALGQERLVPALRTFASELADPTGDLVVAALVLAAGHEARKLSDLLGSLAGAARDQAAMQLRIDAGRARIRTSTNVVVGSTLSRGRFDRSQPLIPQSFRYGARPSRTRRHWHHLRLFILVAEQARTANDAGEIPHTSCEFRNWQGCCSRRPPIMTSALVCGAGVGVGILVILRRDPDRDESRWWWRSIAYMASEAMSRDITPGAAQ